MLFLRMPLCAIKHLARGCGLAVAAALALPVGLAARQVPEQLPQRPPNVSDQQIQSAIQQRGLGSLIQERIQESGLTPDQIRARLQAAGYSPDLLDQYLGANADSTAKPTANMLRALAQLGLAQGVPSDTLSPAFTPESLAARAESLAAKPMTAAESASAVIYRTRGVPQLFGLDVFRRSTTQFTPVLTGPVDPAYRLGAGDELVLILTGDVERADQLPVTREGFVVIPQVGQIYVANLTLDQLRDLLYARLGRVYSGVRRGPNATTHFDVTVSRVRVNQVYIVGEVAKPGSYAVSALATVMNALYQAGGPTERGDFRAVRITRAGQPDQTLDLYDYLLRGNTHGDIRLEQGDVIFVPPRSRRVLVTGEVIRPAIYDLAAGEGLRELIQMSGGLLPDAYTGRAQIIRVLPPDQREPGGHDRTVVDVDLQDALQPGAPPVPLEGGDSVRVFPVTLSIRNRVVIAGDVWRPGAYQLDSGMTLSRLIAEAGGLRPDVYADRAHLVRINPDSSRRLLPVSLVGIPPQGAPDSGEFALPLAHGIRPVPIGHLQVDPELQEFDSITVYSKTGFRPTRQIAVYGNVQRPGVFTFTDSMTLRDAVMMAGGLRDDAYLLQADISRIPQDRSANTLAQIITVPLDSNYVLDVTGYLQRPTNSRGAEPKLQPYDNVFIRRIPGWELQRNVYVTGEVRFPGRYTLTRRDEPISSVLRRAGGLTNDAYVRGAQFYRAEGRAGRIGIDLEHVLRDSSYRDNLILLAGDSLYVPQYQPIVRVDGSVNSPVAVAYVPGENTRFYIDRAGGFARHADKGRTYVVQPNGAVTTAKTRPEPGSRVYVPEIPAADQRTDWAQILTTVATALTAALTAVVVVGRL